MLRSLPELELSEAWVATEATFLAAAEELTSQPVPVIAVLDRERRVVGLFGGDELLRGLFPAYLAELRHTAFAKGDLGILAEQTARVRDEPVGNHMGKAVIVDVDTSATHIAERFLHCDFAAIGVVENDRFVGMLDRAAFCRAVMRQA